MPAIILSIAAAFSAMKRADSDSRAQCGTEQATAVPATTKATANPSVERHRKLGASSMICLLAGPCLLRCSSSGLTNKINNEFEVRHERGSREAFDGSGIAVEGLDLEPGIRWSESAVALGL